MKATSTSFRPGQSGNPAGRAPGSRNRATLAIEVLLDGEAEQLGRKAVDMALAGDATALRLCLDRLLPPRKDRPIKFELPPIETPRDLTKATSSLLKGVAAGEITPAEATEIGRLLETHMRAVQTTDLIERLERLEGGGQ